MNLAIPVCAYRLIVLVFIGTLAAAGIAHAGSNSCLDCHGDSAKMEKLGYPHFAVSAKEVKEQTGMPAACADCHLGKPDRKGKEEAHQGMGRLLLMKKKGLTAEPAHRKVPLEVGSDPAGTITYLSEKEGRKVPDPEVGAIVYQDKRPDTLAQDFTMMEKTCGKCHAKEFGEFRKSTMGANSKERQYRSWSDKERGPHACGVWSEGNYDKIAAATTVPFSRDNSLLNQRACNSCHVGCLDCHYRPMNRDPAKPRQGMHTFNRVPPAETCYGGGRGVSCHAGPEEGRRGAGYFGGSLSGEPNPPSDVHLAKKVGCLDCHETSGANSRIGGHGTVRRRGKCFTCHEEAVRSHPYSVHKMLSCEACHIQNVGGSQATFWGPGTLAGVATPFYPYRQYDGMMKEPILVRDQTRRWIPVKPVPMAVMNQKGEYAKPLLRWRYRYGVSELEKSDDAWGYVGIVDGLPEKRSALLWIQMDKLSHGYGKSRSCASCHDLPRGEQRQTVLWEYRDAGASPFTGGHTVVGSRTGLAIVGMKANEKIEPLAGYLLSNFAPWSYLPDKWTVRGDFSLPPLKDRKKYDEARETVEKARQIKVVHGK